MTDNFNAYSRYYDLLYKDKNYQEEADYVIKLIKEYQPRANQIIELGCGTGNHAALFCEKGFGVTGLERSSEMVAQAKEKSIRGFSPQISDITTYNVNETFDVAVSLFHVISYLTGNKELVSCLTVTHRHLNPKGIFIFDIWYSPAVYFQKPETRIKKMDDTEVEVIRLAQPEVHLNTNVIDVNYEILIRNKETGITDIYHEKHPMRHFSVPEIELLAKHTGYKVVRTEEFLTGATPGANTWGVCVVLQKI